MSTGLKIIIIIVGCVLALIAFSRPPADAVTTPPAPNHPVITTDQLVRMCNRRHRGDWPATAACRIRATWTGTPRTAREAVRVAWCESSINPHAGIPHKTYWGAWQFNHDARTTYHWGPTLAQQTAATKRIYDARHWQPFPRCKPGGIDHAPRWRRAPRTVRSYG